MPYFFKTKAFRCSFIVVGWSLLSFSIFYFAKYETILAMTEEDGLIEYAGALFLFLTSICYFVTFGKNRESNNFFLFKTRKNLFFLFLGILFLVGFFEEISWGQRIFNIATPESIKARNVQEEITIHNLEMFQFYTKEGEKKTGIQKYLTSNKLLVMFWATFCIVIPLLNWKVRPVRRFFQNINLPISPLFIGALFLFNQYFVKIVGSHVQDFKLLRNSLVETKETNFSLTFMMLAIWFLVAQIAKLREEKERQQREKELGNLAVGED